MPAVITRTPEETGVGRVHLAVTVHKRNRRRWNVDGWKLKGHKRRAGAFESPEALDEPQLGRAAA